MSCSVHGDWGQYKTALGEVCMYCIKFMERDKDIAQTRELMQSVRAMFCHAWMSEDQGGMTEAMRMWDYCMLRLKLLREPRMSVPLLESIPDFMIYGGGDE